jgi:hypothetical protein
MPPIVQPVVSLVAWSWVMLAWMTVVRLRAMQAVDNPALTRKRGTRGADLEAVLPPSAQWPAHNYNHLMEQPTLFYAICLVLALTGVGRGIDLYLAWSYVLLRVLHSLVQATVNIVQIRFPLYSCASILLLAMTAHAAMLVF